MRRFLLSQQRRVFSSSFSIFSNRLTAQFGRNIGQRTWGQVKRFETVNKKFFSSTVKQAGNGASKSSSQTRIINALHHLHGPYYAVQLLGIVLSPIALVSIMMLTDELDQRLEHWRIVFSPPKKLGSVTNLSQELLTVLVPKSFRDKVCDVIKMIKAKKTRVIFFYGKGGVGKHDLAVTTGYQMYQRSESHPELYTHAEHPSLYSFNASNQTELENSFRRCHQSLGLGDAVDKSFAAVIKDCVAEIRKRPGAILIFKCVKKFENINEILQQLGDARVNVLVTTGSQDVASQSSEAGYELIDLHKPLLRSDLTDAMSANPSRFVESMRPVGWRIMDEINGDPAVFRHVCAYLLATDISMIDYEKAIKNKSAKNAQEKLSYQARVISFSLVAADHECPEAVELLSVIAKPNEPQHGAPLRCLQKEFAGKDFDAAFDALAKFGFVRLTDQGRVFPILPISVQNSGLIKNYLKTKQDHEECQSSLRIV